MPDFNADGDVIDVALHTVKVQNWDKTITTIPTHKLISESFRNWRGMSESGGRRIKRSLLLDQNSIRFLTKKGVLNLLDKDSPLTLREREIVILRVTANKDCEYEWGVHVTAFAKAAKLTHEQIVATRLREDDAKCWTPKESLLVRCVDELCTHAKIQDDTYERFQECWDLEQQLEILALCGNYHTVGFVANTSRLPSEQTAAKFPI